MQLTGNSDIGLQRLFSNMDIPCRVPLDAYASCLNLPGEPLTFPRYALLEKYPKLRYTTATTGGHFGNLEVPGVIAQDIIQSITFMGKEPEKTPPTP